MSDRNISCDPNVKLNLRWTVIRLNGAFSGQYQLYRTAIGWLPVIVIALTGLGTIVLLSLRVTQILNLATLTIALATLLAVAAIVFLQKLIILDAEKRIREKIARAAGVSPKASMEALTSAIEVRYLLALENEARQIRDDKLIRALHSALEGERQAGAVRLTSAIESERRTAAEKIEVLRTDFERAAKALFALGAGRTRVRLGETAGLAPEINALSAKLRDLETRLADSYFQLAGADLPESDGGLFAHGEALARYIDTFGLRSDEDILISQARAPGISAFTIRAGQLTADLSADAASLAFVLEEPARQRPVLMISNPSARPEVADHQERSFPEQLTAATG